MNLLTKPFAHPCRGRGQPHRLLELSRVEGDRRPFVKNVDRDTVVADFLARLRSTYNQFMIELSRDVSRLG